MADASKTTDSTASPFHIKEGEPIKDGINRESLRESAVLIQSIYAPFPVEEFIESTIDDTWEGLELKARWRQITLKLGKYLPEDYKEALAVLDEVAERYSAGVSIMGLSFPDFIEVYGQDDDYWEVSMAALARYTVYWSAEFAVRPFIIQQEERMMAQMLSWSKHDNEHVRRLSSEGCRPALPWGQALRSFKKDPSPVLPILEQLKTDDSAYVRKSVANNLNDISKTHPDLVATLAKDWYGEDERSDWIVKHACRTLLKKGNRDVLSLFGYGDTESIRVNNLSLGSMSVDIGEVLIFSFAIESAVATKVRLEYGIDYVKANGKRNRKIFQISELSLKKNEKREYTKKHSFANLSTRKHYPGTHSITLIVNGEERGTLDFELR